MEQEHYDASPTLHAVATLQVPALAFGMFDYMWYAITLPGNCIMLLRGIAVFEVLHATYRAFLRLRNNYNLGFEFVLAV